MQFVARQRRTATRCCCRTPAHGDHAERNRSVIGTRADQGLRAHHHVVSPTIVLMVGPSCLQDPCPADRLRQSQSRQIPTAPSARAARRTLQARCWPDGEHAAAPRSVQGAAPVITDMLGGRIHIAFIGTSRPCNTSLALRLLATADAQPPCFCPACRRCTRRCPGFEVYSRTDWSRRPARRRRSSIGLC